MDPKMFINRILETENLTDMLGDDEANRLLDWGTGQVSDLIEKAAGDKVNQLMAVMRKLNTLVADRNSLSQDQLVAEMQSLQALHRQAFVHERADSPETLLPMAAELAGLNDGQAVDYLIKWLTTEAPSQ